MSAPARVLLVDNYDSYVWNLDQRIGEITGVRCHVVRNDRVTLEECRALAPTHVVLSPGPGNPEEEADFGVCRSLILALGLFVPLLGVCLGHQGIGAAFGGRVVRARRPMHGRTSLVTHDGEGIFAGLPRAFTAMRYHSLTLDEATLPGCLRVTARADDGEIMAVAHRELPIFGVQFHPESIGTPDGPALLRNFLAMRPRP